jgi:ribosome-associated protein
MTLIHISPGLAVDDRFLEERFVRASGPGGQNVNKVASAVELRFDVNAAPLPDDMKQRLVALAGTRIGSDGVLTIDSRAFRTSLKTGKPHASASVNLLKRAAHVPSADPQATPDRAKLGSLSRSVGARRRRRAQASAAKPTTIEYGRSSCSQPGEMDRNQSLGFVFCSDPLSRETSIDSPMQKFSAPTMRHTITAMATTTTDQGRLRRRR